MVHEDKTLIGVVSSSPLGCMENMRPGIYSRVSAYLDLIRGAMRGEVDSSVIAVPIKTNFY